jgi:hypothetical protein
MVPPDMEEIMYGEDPKAEEEIFFLVSDLDSIFILIFLLG